MDAKQYAEELIDDFLFTTNEYNEYCDIVQAKQCALITLKRIQLSNPIIKGDSSDLTTMIVQTKAFFSQVEEEIKKL
ncbi:MAG: hypothetical protein B7Y83_00255 [Flavobacteriales bacterium 32-34-25]|nr:MAG: hypothetical protein B7Y83_00255 [Flavobacteriales bacterium 32-34-25]